MARPRFQPKITRARYVVSGFTTSEMLQLGREYVDIMKSRIAAAKTIYDTDAPPLKPKYLEQKAKFSASAIRDLKRTGAMLSAMTVTQVNANSAHIYFTSPRMVQRMAFNQRRAPQWGASPSDRAAIGQKVEDKQNVQAVQVGPIYKVA